jgi:thiamine biosynthesis lipoprotein
MGMDIRVEIVDSAAEKKDAAAVFEYFNYVDNKFSTYKADSEISKINRGLIKAEDFSEDMKTVFALAEETRKQTNGYFDISKPDGSYDPSGLVKGWAIEKAANILKRRGLKNFYVEAGGDIQANGKNQAGESWSVGIKNPFNQKEIVKVVYISNLGMATSGTYIRGQHIYNPHKPKAAINDIVSLTVIGPNIYQADRFATAAFAMGKEGIAYIEQLDGFEGYIIDKEGIATMTSGFEKHTVFTRSCLKNPSGCNSRILAACSKKFFRLT